MSGTNQLEVLRPAFDPASDWKNFYMPDETQDSSLAVETSMLQPQILPEIITDTHVAEAQEMFDRLNFSRRVSKLGGSVLTASGATFVLTSWYIDLLISAQNAGEDPLYADTSHIDRTVNNTLIGGTVALAGIASLLLSKHLTVKASESWQKLKDLKKNKSEQTKNLSPVETAREAAAEIGELEF